MDSHTTPRGGGDLEDPEYRRQRLEEKKQQLQALRKQREEQERKLKNLQQRQDHLSQGTGGEKDGKQTQSDHDTNGNQESLDSYIESLLSAPVPGQKEDQKEKLIDEALQRLSLSNEKAITNIAPTSRDSYNRSVQTEEEEYMPLDDTNTGRKPDPESDAEDNENKVEEGTQVEDIQDFSEVGKYMKRNAQDLETEMHSSQFQDFLHNVTRPMERALDATTYGDYLRNLLLPLHSTSDGSDYSGDQTFSHILSLVVNTSTEPESSKSTRRTKTVDERAKAYLSRRCISSISCYSVDSEEYVLAVYRNSLPMMPQTPRTFQQASELVQSFRRGVFEYVPDGVASIWNLMAPSVPERLVYSSSEIMCLLRHPSVSTMVIGGLRNGQIVRWDTSSGGEPVEASALLQDKGHFSPIRGMEMISAETSTATLVTICEDGTVCSWAPNQLMEPIMQSQLAFRPSERDIALAKDFASSAFGHVANSIKSESEYDVVPGAISFPHGDSSSLYIGGEDGCIYVGTLSNRAARLTKRLLGHTSPVRIIRHHPGVVTETSKRNRGHHVASDVFLTAGIEWKIHIWSPGILEEPISSWELAHGPPTDVQWCPYNPSIFAVGDGSGRMHLFDVFQEDFSPFVTEKCSEHGITSIEWSQKRRQLYIGDNAGEVSVWNVRADRLRSKNDSQPSLSSLMDALQKWTKKQSASKTITGTL
eukprot:gb/GECG01010479.1/.p1 GENE.gb/GECG01010479.1/~~gb/GECG01010479.1/.p1  ORF type:complete len:703 (+),score=87.34 gb/GECG01010479.1/:1-2109(+)